MPRACERVERIPAPEGLNRWSTSPKRQPLRSESQDPCRRRALRRRHTTTPRTRHVSTGCWPGLLRSASTKSCSPYVPQVRLAMMPTTRTATRRDSSHLQTETIRTAATRVRQHRATAASAASEHQQIPSLRCKDKSPTRAPITPLALPSSPPDPSLAALLALPIAPAWLQDPL